MQQAAVLARHLPAWTDPGTGLPRSWQHFAHGMRAIGRDDVQRTLDRAGSIRAGMAQEEDYTAWRNGLLDGVDS